LGDLDKITKLKYPFLSKINFIKMKKILILALSLSFLFGLSACSDNGTANIQDSSKKILQKSETGDIKVELQASAESIKVDEYLDISVRFNTGREFVNTTQLFMNYDSELLDVDHITTAYSKFTIWTKKEIKDGVIQLQAAEPNPGISGSNIELATIVFKAKKDGEANITVDSNISKIYTADNTNKIKKTDHKNLNIKILPFGLEENKEAEAEESTT